MSMYYLRPNHLKLADGRYWPEGIPEESDKTKVHDIRFSDEDGVQFSISYTGCQIGEIVKRTNGVWFPFVPVGVTGVVKE